MRVTIVTNVPTPYRVPLYDAIDERLIRSGGQLTVIYGALFRGDRQWSNLPFSLGRAQVLVVKGAQIQIGRRVTYASPRVVGALRASTPDAVVFGGFAPWVMAGAAWCRLSHVPYWLWSGETLESARSTNPNTSWRRALARQAKGLLAYGPAAAQYLLSLDVPERRITVLGNGIDTDAFAAKVNYTRAERHQLRENLGLRGPTILSVGGKGLEAVVAALRFLPSEVRLLVVGRRPSASAHPAIVDLGSVAPSQMPSVYAVSDCLAHLPEWDRWPHAINEALSAGLPVVATRFCGVPDEILTGPGSALVDKLSAKSLGGALRTALDVGVAIGDRVRTEHLARLQPWSASAMASRLVVTLGAETSHPPNPA